MAKKPAPNAAPAKVVTQSITRKRRNANERKSLPKAMKILFAGSGTESFRSILRAWQDGRKRTAPV